ncbi:uncharacterized protein LOC142605961 [Castanea sativa]|uniref:uncharacterized protein LOC142605961 n=1 Tax=Castanea sativa TaxID=21020 RepID=UPI003F64D1C8
MIDAASGGALVDKTPEATRNLIENMAANSQQFGTRLDPSCKHVNEVNISSLEQQIASLTSLVHQMAIGNMQTVQACGICSVVGHPTDMCPTLQEKPIEQLIVALAESRKDEQNKDLYETFCRCEVNIPFLDAIKQVACYDKFLKELCTIKRKQKLKGCKKVRVGENVSAIIQRKLPTKCKDPVENGLVQVNDLVFPTDFFVLDLENGDQTTPILLGRPFLKTSKIEIDVHSGTLTMEFDGEIVKFNIYDAMKYRNDDNPVYSIDVIDSLAHEVFELDGKDGMEVAISKHLEKENEELALSTDL